VVEVEVEDSAVVVDAVDASVEPDELVEPVSPPVYSGTSE
jgi:hypothetical protein